MKEHPGRFCSQCNPKAEEDNDEGLSDEDAEMSDSWSDSTASSFDDRSLTYSEIWYMEEEKNKVTKYIKGKIEAVGEATTRLKTLVADQHAGKPPIGGLRGEWTLYNLDVCPKRYEPTGEYYRLTVSEAAFPFPSHASLEPVSIRLMTTRSDDVPAEIVFLGNDCLWLRVPRAIVYPNQTSQPCGQAGDHVWTSNAYSVARQWQYKQPR